MLAMAAVVAVNGPVIVLIALAMVAASGSAFFYPAVGAYIPALAKDEAQLGPANSAWAGLGNLSFIIGPALGGVLIAAGGVDLAFILNAASFLVIAAILWTLPPSHAGQKATTETAPAESETAATESEAAATKAAEPTDSAAPVAAAAAASRIPLVPITGLGLIQVIVGFLDGGIQSVTIVLAVTVLNAGEEANGYLNAAIGVGGLIGAVISGVLVLRRHLRNPMLAGILLIVAGVAVLGAVPILGVAMIAIGVSSAGSILLDVVLTTIFQRLVPDALRGRALGFLMTANTVSAAAGAFVMPVLVVALGAPLALGLFAGLVLVGTLTGVAMLGGATSRPVSPFESTLLRVAKLPIFAGVPPSRLEAALGHVVPSRSRPARSLSSRAIRPTASSSSRAAGSP
jgi:MFS family permease